MDKITVAELATECSVQNQVVLSELKRLGLYVFSSFATIDATFADTIRKKIFSQREAEESHPPVEQVAPLPEHLPRHEEPVPHPGTVARKIIVPKTKTKILMRTS